MSIPNEGMKRQARKLARLRRETKAIEANAVASIARLLEVHENKNPQMAACIALQIVRQVGKVV